MIRNLKLQIEENLNTIKLTENDLKYLHKLFGTIPTMAKPAPEALTYNYGFFDNFSLLFQPIDKFTPKFGVNLQTNKDYVIKFF